MRQEAATSVSTNTTTEEHVLMYNMFNVNASAAAEATTTNEDILWDGLWNLDDVHGNFGVACAANKASVHNLVAPSC
ncbi:hypothetical protein Tsubulata_014259 [Turnera subulata]|uniref:Uncharacterized protein n=1 Tax=Turnera subulata TaxID=218843 RepID=A0A9Q0G2A8_9ROSI|nr:hypothetical protein Tsubulata_014259 [Turnera subulata]